MQDQPFGAVKPVAPLMVTITVQVFAPRVIFPAAAPPVVAETEHPEVVNFVPPETNPADVVLVGITSEPTADPSEPQIVSTVPEVHNATKLDVVPPKSSRVNEVVALFVRRMTPLDGE